MTRALVVLAHPLRQSLCGHLAARVQEAAREAAWEVTFRDLCAEGFDPRLSESERSSYYSVFHSEAEKELEDLARAEVLILIFPTWWFGFPAVLKGWFDRVWAPGTAYDHAPAPGADGSADTPPYGPMIPRLHGLREVLALTTLGAPGWIDWLVMRRPLRRVLAWGIVKPCAPKARVTWRALYRAEAVESARLQHFEALLAREIAAMARRLR